LFVFGEKITFACAESVLVKRIWFCDFFSGLE